MSEVLIARWDGEGYNPSWKCYECGKVATVIRDGFTHDMETRYVCISCLEGKVKEIKEAVLTDKVAIATT